ncbi:MAG: glutamate-1-semialdehyde 2,1-aminomutase [Calditrichota bacterium]
MNSSELWNSARKLIPGGVSSPVRAFKAVDCPPLIIASASGSRLWDVNGREFIDFIGSWGPMIAGHAHPQVVEAIREAAGRGASFGLTNPAELELAAEIGRRMPNLEMIRFVNSGTEAAMSAVRLARAFTQRTKIIKFAGGYHGHADSFLAAAGSGAATLGLPDSPGVTPGAAQDTLIADYNDLDSVNNIFQKFSGQVAALIVEPVAGNMGVVPPEPGFLEGLRGLCDRYESLLIFDEVITGFRVGEGGAQELYGVRPDLTLLGKIIGGGLPVGAFGGRRDIMMNLAPEGPVYQAGTLSGNPLAMAAGLATLRLLDKSAYKQLENISSKLQSGLESILLKRKTFGVVQRVGSLLTLFFRSESVKNFSEARQADHRRFAAFFREMIAHGIALPPSGFEAWFLSLTHSEEDINQTLVTADKALKNIL